MNFELYRRKVYGCFMGKCVGGTLGMKYEGSLTYQEVTYYDPVPDKMLPNDDLDLQVVNLETILRTGLPICRYHLGATWRHHIADHAPDEYAVAVSNHALMMNAPLSGQYRNKFYAGMGGAIRSELWACLAPANPHLAATFAREDACTDHCSDGVYAEMFLAAVESAAFQETDLIKLIDIGMRYIPDGHKLKNAFLDVIAWWKEEGDILLVRKRILEKYYVDNWTDVTINLSFIILSLLCCDGSFDKAICTAASLAYDADCTAATVASIFGIIDPDGISQKWTAPIGDRLVLSSTIVNMHEPSTIDAFCNKIISVAEDVQAYYATNIFISLPDGFEKTHIAVPWTNNYSLIYDWTDDAKESLLCVRPVNITLQYPDTVAMIPNAENRYGLTIANTTEERICGSVVLSMPEGFCIDCGETNYTLMPGECTSIPFTVTTEQHKRRTPLNILTISTTINSMTFDVNAGLPVSFPWVVENLESDTTSVFEAPDIYFNIPAGRYRYTATFKSPSDKEVRICAGGRRAFTLYLNGVEMHKHTGEHYVPAFHRDGGWFKASVQTDENIVEVIFENGKEGEFFFGFSTTFGCATWIDTMERLI
ncbi:MAG: ADP-ribosylglycohydrolase family protein [Clostridia bacterium]|nr:ADP-ribosylglycohydrolase family protein [Clostridia bacterium]